MTKVVVFLKPDRIGGVCFGPGEVAGFDDRVADNLCSREFAMRRGYNEPFAKLYGKGEPKQAGGRIPFGEKANGDLIDPDLLKNQQEVDLHIAKLKKEGKWPAYLDAPIIVFDPEVANAYHREQESRGQNRVR